MKTITLLLLPLAYIYLGSVYIGSIDAFYMCGPDPVYAYLFNGLNLASGQFEVGHIDHPGTPMQYFVAAVIFVKHLFTGQAPLPQDVLDNPESYLYACCIALIILLGAAFFITGTYVYRKTGNLFWSVLYQLVPLLVPYGYTHIVVPRPEAFIVMAGSFLSAYVFVNFRSLREQQMGWIPEKELIVMAALTSLLVALKITCTPVFVGLFFLVKGWRRKFSFSFLSLFFAVMFTLPALSKHVIIKQWIRNLVTHDGIYGSGQERFADPERYWRNMGEVFTTDYLFTFIYVALFLSLVLSVFKYKKRFFSMDYAALTVGTWLILTLFVVIIAKHYSFHYLIPAYCFLIPAVHVSVKNMEGPGFSFFSKFSSLRYIALSVGVLLLLKKSIADINYAFGEQRNPVLDTREYIREHKNIPVIITSEYESAFIEPALHFGITYSGRMAQDYYDFMTKKFSRSFLYRINDRKMLRWGVEYMPYEALKKYRQMLVYFKNTGRREEESVLNELSLFGDSLTMFTYSRAYSNDRTKECLYMIDIDSVLVSNLPVDSTVIFSDLEKMSEDGMSFLTQDNKYQLQNTNSLDHTQCFSGSNSVRVDQLIQYGLVFNFDVKPQSYLVDLSIWRRSKDEKAIVVFEYLDRSVYLWSGAVILKRGYNDWKQVGYRLKLPRDIPVNKVKFYVFAAGSEETWFDDLQIKVFSVRQKN